MNIFVLRHGETYLNVMQKNQGWIDSDLTDSGIEALKEIFLETELPNMDIVYCSDLGRAKKTLEVIQDTLKNNSFEKIVYTKQIRERFLGSFEGESLNHIRQLIAEKSGYKSFDELINDTSFWHFIDLTKEFDPLSLAENFTEFANRINEFLEQILEVAHLESHENIMIVSHANTVKYIVNYLSQEEYNEEILNGKVIKISYNDEHWTIR